MTGAAPFVLDRAGIAARIPHQRRMCLLDRLLAWDAESIECAAVGHRDPAHPLRTAGGLLAPAAIEYAGQAMALHGALLAQAGGADEAAGGALSSGPGYLASVRGVRLAVARLDDIDGELRVRARQLAGDGRQRLYAFEVADAGGRRLVDGRASVALGVALPADAPPGTPA